MNSSGYVGYVGEVWLTRVLPPLVLGQDVLVVQIERARLASAVDAIANRAP